SLLSAPSLSGDCRIGCGASAPPACSSLAGGNPSMTIIRLALLCALLGLLPGAANSQPAASQADAINALRQGGHVIVFRHGATHNDQADTDPLNLGNVTKQRQLN